MICSCTSVLLGLFRRCFSFLFLAETLLVFLQPGFKIVRGLFEFVAIEQATTQRFEECASTNVVGELFVSFEFGSFSDSYKLSKRCSTTECIKGSSS